MSFLHRLSPRGLNVRNARGSAIVFGAAMIALTMGLSALVVDAGFLYREKTRLQQTADAAALAGARQLPDSADALDEAQDIATENGFTDGADGVVVSTLINPDGHSPGRLQVEITAPQETIFARILGVNNTSVTARATAVVMTPLEMTPPVNSVNNSFALMAGQHMHAGTVTITNDNQHINFKFETTGGWSMNEAHLYVGTTPANSEAPGTFPYKITGLAGATEYTFEVPNTWPVGTDLYLAGHAVVKNQTNTETAWGQGDCLAFKKKWGWYICYTTLQTTTSGVGGALAHIPAAAAGSKIYVNKYHSGPVSAVDYEDEHGNTWTGEPAPANSWRMDSLDVPDGYPGGDLLVMLEGDSENQSVWELYYEGTGTEGDSIVRLID